MAHLYPRGSESSLSHLVPARQGSGCKSRRNAQINIATIVIGLSVTLIWGTNFSKKNLDIDPKTFYYVRQKSVHKT